MEKKLEFELDSILEEISKDTISEFKYENGKGMLMKFSGGDQYTEFIFGAAEFNSSGLKERVVTEQGLNNCKLKQNFIREKIIRIQLLKGDLLLSFKEGNSILFPHSKTVENWEIRWKSRITITSLAGGEIGIF